MEEYAPCPNCGRSAAEKVGYTLWGGSIVPRLMHHVKCKYCGKTYNGKTGNSNTPLIITYNLVILIAVILFLWLL